MICLGWSGRIRNGVSLQELQVIRIALDDVDRVPPKPDQV
jgi:hypothetical protein